MKYCLLVALSIYTTINCTAQKLNSKKKDKPRPEVMMAALYGNNVNYYGQAAEQTLPYIFFYTNVTLPNGLYGFVDVYRLLNNTEAASAGDLGLGYRYSITGKITGSIDYTRSFYPRNSPVVQAANTNFISNSFDFDWEKFRTALTADYAFGVQNDVFLSVGNSKSFDLGSLFNKSDYVSFEPGVTLIAGTQHYYKTYYTTIYNKPGKKNGKKKPTPETVENTIEARRFNMLSYNFKFPVAYNQNKYIVEAAYELSILGKQVEALSRKPNSFFNLSVYYTF